MSRLGFRRITSAESRIYQDGDYIGDVVARDDALRPGERYFVIHLNEDPRGPRRLHDRRRIREVAQRLVDSHPLW